MYAAAFCRRSSAIASAGSGPGSGSTRSCIMRSTNDRPSRARRTRSVDLDALLFEILLRARVERNRRAQRLALELDVLCLFVHGDELGLLVEQRLDDRVGHL